MTPYEWDLLRMIVMVDVPQARAPQSTDSGLYGACGGCSMDMVRPLTWCCQPCYVMYCSIFFLGYCNLYNVRQNTDEND